MTVRAKFRLTKKADIFGSEAKELTFNAEYDNSIAEDMNFNKYTPYGQFVMVCCNPAALAQFELGKQYYFDMNPATPVPVKPAAGEGAQPSA